MPKQSFWCAFGPEPAPNGAHFGSSFANGKKEKQIIVGQLFRFLLFRQEKEEREERKEKEKGKERQKEERQKGEEREKRKKGTVRFVTPTIPRLGVAEERERLLRAQATGPTPSAATHSAPARFDQAKARLEALRAQQQKPEKSVLVRFF